MTAKIKSIKYTDLVNSLLANLSNREYQVLAKRNCLADFPKHTLEQIGKDFNITRERVRQIEKDGLKRLRSLDYVKLNLPINDLQSIISQYLQEHGGVMAETHLMEKLLNNTSPKEQAEQEQKALEFVLSTVLADGVERVNHGTEFHIVWKLEDTDFNKAVEIASILKQLIEKNKQPLHLNDLEESFNNHKEYSYIDQHQAENKAIIESLVRLNKDINKNILDQYGIHNWTTIRPKRMTDKAYLIMLREQRPLHFAEVADLINQANFDRKKAIPATVHNELILDDKYVLVGRGIYALKDWGFQEGTVADIITDVLKQKGPMTKKDLMEQVLKQRLVQKTTITLVLMNKDKFKRTEQGEYTLV